MRFSFWKGKRNQLASTTYADSGAKISVGEGDQFNALINAVKDGDLTVITEILKPLSSDEKKKILTKGLVRGGFTALHFAAQKGDSGVVTFLLKQGASPAIRSNRGNLPIHVALSANINHNKILEIYNLLRDCSSLDQANNEGNTLAHLAAERSLMDILKSLTKSNPELLLRKNNTHQVPLFSAISYSQLEATRFLLTQLGKESTNHQGRNALHIAALEGTVEILQEVLPLFIKHLDDLDRDKYTALHLATLSRDQEKIQCIEEACDTCAENSFFSPNP